MKFTETLVTFKEVPDEATLCINISHCPIHCSGCHSKWLWEDTGKELDMHSLRDLIEKNDGITCIAFMGGDRDPHFVQSLSIFARENYGLKTAWYSGNDTLSNDVHAESFDYIKLGPYKEEFGPLTSKTTNQKFYKVVNGELVDITFKFWK